MSSIFNDNSTRVISQIFDSFSVTLAHFILFFLYYDCGNHILAMHKEMEIIFSSSWTSFGTPQVEIEESTVESKEENEWKVIPRTKMDSSMLAAVRGFLLTTFVSSANVSLVPHEQVRSLSILVNDRDRLKN